MTLTAGINDAGRRLDRILRKALPDMPLSALHRFLRKGLVRVNGSPAKASDCIAAGSLIEIPEDKPGHNSQSNQNKNASQPTVLRQLPLDILWEGSGLLICNKPAGLAVHGSDVRFAAPSGRTGHDSLNRRVLAYLDGKLPPSLSYKPGPLHRLDKPTSGIVVFGTSLEATRWFSALLAQGKIRKTYLAILEGELTSEEIWEDTLVRDTAERKTRALQAGSGNGNRSDGGRMAFTVVTPLACAKKCTLAKLEIKTGRTHQIRAQASFHGYPLTGDRKYGGSIYDKDALHDNASLFNRSFFLHAAELELPVAALPKTALPGMADAAENSGSSMKDFPLVITAPLPEAFLQAIGVLQLQSC